MKTTVPLICLIAVAFLSNGCIRRTVVKQAEQRGNISKGGKFGSDPHDEIMEKKIIWVWQDEFRNP